MARVILPFPLHLPFKLPFPSLPFPSLPFPNHTERVKFLPYYLKYATYPVHTQYRRLKLRVLLPSSYLRVSMCSIFEKGSIRVYEMLGFSRWGRGKFFYRAQLLNYLNEICHSTDKKFRENPTVGIPFNAHLILGSKPSRTTICSGIIRGTI